MVDYATILFHTLDFNANTMQATNQKRPLLGISFQIGRSQSQIGLHRSTYGFYPKVPPTTPPPLPPLPPVSHILIGIKVQNLFWYMSIMAWSLVTDHIRSVFPT